MDTTPTAFELDLLAAVLAAAQPGGLADLCRRAGVDRRLVERWRSGERGITLRVAGKLAAAAGISLGKSQAKRRIRAESPATS